jgi:hypothetical protein
MRRFVVRRVLYGFGRLQKEEWEHTAPTPRPALTVAYGYSNYGGVAQLASSVGLLWSAQGRDALSRLTQATQGNNVVTSYGYNAFTGRLTGISGGLGGGNAVQADSYGYDSVGNLLSRTQRNAVGGTTSETFGYDPLDRLATSQVSGQTAKSYGYDAIGNLTSKSGVGTLAYGAACGGRSCPHAVQSSSVIGAFSYDGNGNLTAGDGLSVTWTAWNQPATITRGATSASFQYGPEHQRVAQVQANPGRTVYYAGAHEQEIAGGVHTHKVYLPLGVGMVAQGNNVVTSNGHNAFTGQLTRCG